MAKITPGDCDLAVMTKKSTRETRVIKENVPMIGARREETTDTTVDMTKPTWSQPAILADATSEMTTDEAIIVTHGKTTNAEALGALEANGRPASPNYRHRSSLTLPATCTLTSTRKTT